MSWIEQVCPDCGQYISPNTNDDETCDGCEADMRPITRAEDEWINTYTDNHPWLPGSLL